MVLAAIRAALFALVFLASRPDEAAGRGGLGLALLVLSAGAVLGDAGLLLVVVVTGVVLVTGVLLVTGVGEEEWAAVVWVVVVTGAAAGGGPETPGGVLVA